MTINHISTIREIAHDTTLTTADFDYHLPSDSIAGQPLPERSSSKLLAYRCHNKSTTHTNFANIVDFLQAGDVLVLNNSRVFPARLSASTARIAQLEVFLLHYPSATTFTALIRPGRKVKVGEDIVFTSQISAKILKKYSDGRVSLKLNTKLVQTQSQQTQGQSSAKLTHSSFLDFIQQYGQTPLPPYIKEDFSTSKQVYQTVYAKKVGSVAAPTAGLHFTPSLLSQIKEKGITVAEATLHVGLGTFRPVQATHLAEHIMHSEYFSLSPATAHTINLAKQNPHARVVAVGTTSARVLETCTDLSGQINSQQGWTDIFITPGYHWKSVDALITNFHLPRSTLLMLVASLTGLPQILSCYQEALSHNYRFYSFGDAMYIER